MRYRQGQLIPHESAAVGPTPLVVTDAGPAGYRVGRRVVHSSAVVAGLLDLPQKFRVGPGVPRYGPSGCHVRHGPEGGRELAQAPRDPVQVLTRRPLTLVGFLLMIPEEDRSRVMVAQRQAHQVATLRMGDRQHVVGDPVAVLHGHADKVGLVRAADPEEVGNADADPAGLWEDADVGTSRPPLRSWRRNSR